MHALVQRFEDAPKLHALRLRRGRQEVGEYRDETLERPDIAQQLEAVKSVPAAQQAQDLFEETRRCGSHQVGCRLRHRRKGLGLDPKAESAGELHRTQDAHRILTEAHSRVADGADRAVVEILEAVGVVEDAVLPHVEEEGVDGEVAAKCVFLSGAELVVVLDQQIRLQVVRAVDQRHLPERRDLEDLRVAVEVQVRQLEPPTNDAAVSWKRALDLLRARRRRYVVVLGA